MSVILSLSPAGSCSAAQSYEPARPALIKMQDRKHRLLQVGAEDRTGVALSSCGDPAARFPSSEKRTDKCHEGSGSRTQAHG